MGPKQLAGVLSIVRRNAAEAAGRDFDEEADEELRAATEHQIEEESTAQFATGRLWDDGIIDPARHPHGARHRADGRALRRRVAGDRRLRGGAALMAASAPPLRRVLVANRGEIARRVIRGAHDAGCEAVAVYAPDDAGSPHVGEADAAVLLAGSVAARDLPRPRRPRRARRGVPEPTRSTPATASSRRARPWPRPAGRPGVVWVGPPPEAMRVMGHKTRAKEVVAAAGVPGAAERRRAPGRRRRRAHGRRPKRWATRCWSRRRRAGVAGACGWWSTPRSWAMRSPRRSARPRPRSGRTRCSWSASWPPPATSRSRSSGDSHGGVLHLFDRECSVQRRHQKVVEEAPAVLVPDRDAPTPCGTPRSPRRRAVGYESAGTVEYLVDGSEFCFLEMNTRLQVEHGVTELVTGLDLVGLQLAVASGRPLPFAQADVSVHGPCRRGAAVRRAAAGGLPAHAGDRDPRALARGCGCAHRPRHRVGQRGQPGLRLARGQADGARRRPGRRRRPAVAGAALARARRARDQPRPAGGGARRRRRFAAATSTSTISMAGPTSATPRCPTRCASAMRPPSRFGAPGRAGGRSLVPVPAAGWRNVGTALHADELRDAARDRSGAGPAPGARRRSRSGRVAGGRDRRATGAGSST